jgi:hypothetical protein
VTDKLGTGGKVEFYIGNEKAEESFIFRTFEVTKTNLTFGKISEEENLCGNGVCDNGECSFCAVDCDFNYCSNGRCDVEVGEDCANSPTDCACSSGYICISRVCTVSTSDGSSGSPGGGSSGSGGGGGSSSSTLLSTDESNENEFTPLTTQNLDEEDEEKQEENSFTNFLTGAVTGVGDFVKSGNGIFVIIGGITVIVLGIASFVGRKKKPVEKKEENSEVSEKKEDGK